MERPRVLVASPTGLLTPRIVEPEKSSTFVDIAKGIFKIAYVDKTSSKGDYFNDVFSLGGATVANLTMGIGIDTDIPFGLLGVGFPVNEAGVASGVIDAYPNLPVQMASEGYTKTVAFSMWLNDLGGFPSCFRLPSPSCNTS